LKLIAYSLELIAGAKPLYFEQNIVIVMQAKMLQDIDNYLFSEKSRKKWD
jgi:hypothetical protein